MPARKTFTTEDILPFIPKLQNRELTRAELAEELGVCLPTLRRELKKLDIAVPSKRHAKPLGDRLLELYTEEQLQTLSQYQIAQELNITQPNVAKALKQIGIKRKISYDTSERDSLCERVVDHIMQNGGSVASTIRELGINVYRNAVYDYCKDRGINLRLYRFAHRRYGHWLTLPCIAQRCYTMDYKVQAECTRCGSVHTVQIVNLRTGASTQCRNCAAKDRRDNSCCKPVVCSETKEKIRSVRTLAERIGVSYSCLLTALKKDGQFVHGGLTYSLVG